MSKMIERVVMTKARSGKTNTAEGRLAAILADKRCVVHIDDATLSASDKARVVRALRLAAVIAELSGSLE